ncbi:hypothetical protein FRB99_002398 [Tulasnella sp. 403]|nr:hypothetical protein FRB99_002398 [Tulasnella sp. 403]
MKNGALPQYLQSHPDADRTKYVLQIAGALAYLHRKGHIHGDIKGQNILVSSDDRALLCDFGLSRAISAFTLPVLKGTSSLPWRSPELWDGERKAFGSDVYAFGLTISQILSGNIPFYNMNTEAALLGAILVRDERPPHDPLTRNGVSYAPIWDVAEACWKKQPGDRLDMAEAFRRLSLAREAEETNHA